MAILGLYLKNIVFLQGKGTEVESTWRCVVLAWAGFRVAASKENDKG